jgi:hypothetical protein
MKTETPRIARMRKLRWIKRMFVSPPVPGVSATCLRPVPSYWWSCPLAPARRRRRPPAVFRTGFAVVEAVELVFPGSVLDREAALAGVSSLFDGPRLDDDPRSGSAPSLIADLAFAGPRRRPAVAATVWLRKLFRCRGRRGAVNGSRFSPKPIPYRIPTDGEVRPFRRIRHAQRHFECGAPRSSRHRGAAMSPPACTPGDYAFEVA